MLIRAKLLAAVLLATSLSLGACASNPGPGGGSAIAGDEAQVRVSNHNWADMTVYVLRSGMRQRLGTVTSMASRVFELPRTLTSTAGDLQLMVDPIGSGETHTTPAVQVWPGQTVELKIENHLAISSISVFE